MTAPAKQSVEEAAREAAEAFIEKWKERRREIFRGYRAESVNALRLGLIAGHIAGHASRDAEVEAMRAKRIEELEGLAAEVCEWVEYNQLECKEEECPCSPIRAAIARAKGEG